MLSFVELKKHSLTLVFLHGFEDWNSFSLLLSWRSEKWQNLKWRYDSDRLIVFNNVDSMHSKSCHLANSLFNSSIHRNCKKIMTKIEIHNQRKMHLWQEAWLKSDFETVWSKTSVLGGTNLTKQSWVRKIFNCVSVSQTFGSDFRRRTNWVDKIGCG